VIALSVMFLLVFIGALFVAMIARNLTRVSRTGNRSSAAALADSALNWVNTQLTYSELGADWRPSPTWPTRQNAAAEALRQRDPDWFWLSDQGSYQRPWTRISSGDGRFLIRIDYEPARESTVANAAQASDPNIYDPLSSYLHIRAVGRPGRIEDDPTLLSPAGSQPTRADQTPGQYMELEAWKPIGLTDQLLWITDKNKERGPAVVGVPPLQDGQGRSVLYPQILDGGLRSNEDVLFQGPTIIDLYPRSGEYVGASGSLQIADIPSGGKAAVAPVQVHVYDESLVAANVKPTARRSDITPRPSDSTAMPVVSVTELPSDAQQFQFNYPNATNDHGVFLDNVWLTDNTVAPQRSLRYLEPPSIDLTESGSQDNRYRRMTRDTGMLLSVKVAGAARQINAGDYGWGDGIYVDNFTDLQYPDNRDNVVNEWLRRGPPDVSQTGWAGNYYTPSVRESGTVHPVLLVELLPTGIRMTRYDRDVQGRNLEPENQYKSRIFYQAASKSNPNHPPSGPTDVGTLAPVGPTILMPYPQDGVLYTEGSLRIKGTIGQLTSGGAQPVNLTVVSGGSIYIEGNLVKASPASHLALLAHDYVCLNPTQFSTVRPYEDVTIQPDSPGANTFHYEVPQNKDLDVVFTSSAPLTSTGMLLNLQHSAGFSDNSSTTSVTMYVNGLDPGHRYDFNAEKPSGSVTAGSRFGAAGGAVTGGGGSPYQFQFFPPPSAPDWWLSSWAVSNFQSSPTSTVNYERKSFWIPAGLLHTGAGAQNVFRFHVDPTPDGQPWWLAGASLIPWHEPLDIEVEATIYAENGSWFVVPMPWANDNPLDRRELFMSGDPTSSRAPGTRAYGTFPADSDDYPFYREPLNMGVTVRGSITEGTTAEGTSKAQWIKRMTMGFIDPQTGKPVGQLLKLPGWYQPNINYVYDQGVRDWVRTRNVVTGEELVAYVGPPSQQPQGAVRLDTIRAAAMQQSQNIVTLPVLPRLPTSGTLFRGRPIQ
jgi:hypothetical protein